MDHFYPSCLDSLIWLVAVQQALLVYRWPVVILSRSVAFLKESRPTIGQETGTSILDVPTKLRTHMHARPQNASDLATAVVASASRT